MCNHYVWRFRLHSKILREMKLPIFISFHNTPFLSFFSQIDSAMARVYFFYVRVMYVYVASFI